MSFRPKSEWISFTPTGAFNTNCVYTGRYRRIGDSLHMRVKITFSGAPNSVSAYIDLPPGFTVDTNKLVGTLVVGCGWLNQSGGFAYDLAANCDSNTILIYAKLASSSYAVIGGGTRVTQALPTTIANLDIIEIDVTVPILGW